MASEDHVRKSYYKKAHTTDGEVFQQLLEVVENEAYVCWLVRPWIDDRPILIFREFPDYGYDLEGGHVHCSLETELLCANKNDNEVLRPLFNKKILKKAKLAIIDNAEKRIVANQIRLSEKRSEATESDRRERNRRYWEMLNRSILAGKVAEILQRERVYLALDWIMTTEAFFNSVCVVKDNPEFVEHQAVSYVRPEPAFAHPIEKDRRVIPVAWKTDENIPDNSQLETLVVKDRNFIPFLEKAISRLKE